MSTMLFGPVGLAKILSLALKEERPGLARNLEKISQVNAEAFRIAYPGKKGEAVSQDQIYSAFDDLNIPVFPRAADLPALRVIWMEGIELANLLQRNCDELETPEQAKAISDVAHLALGKALRMLQGYNW